jgi:hypothetical protein
MKKDFSGPIPEFFDTLAYYQKSVTVLQADLSWLLTLEPRFLLFERC